MNFVDLYRIAEALDQPPVGFDYLRRQVVAYHKEVGRVDVYATTYPVPNRQAHFRYGESDRSSAYDEEFLVAEIRFCETLSDDEAEYRFALTKELMHVFDKPEEVVDTREKFIALLMEIQNEPLAKHASPMYRSEVNTRWMALLVLCPKRFRDQYVERYRAGDLANFDIAATFGIPEWTVPHVMSDYYQVVYETFVNGNGNGH